MSDYKELKKLIESNPSIQKEVEQRKQTLPNFSINGIKAKVDNKSDGFDLSIKQFPDQILSEIPFKRRRKYKAY